MWKYIGKDECNEFLLSLKLFKCKNNKKYINTLYSISNNIKNNYKIYKIKKKTGGFRKIYAPNKILKEIQKNILKNILNNKQISKYAKAYHKNISLKDNAIEHINKKKILKLDIKNFFDNITFFNVYKSCFPIEYFPKSVGMLLTHLCTYDEHLIQGAPTSSYISNLVLKDFDEELGYWCKEKGVSYTRYSDDLTFSGDLNVRKIIKKVRKMLYEVGLELNDEKTKVINQSQNQNVTGITVNKKMQVNIKYRKKIRQEVFYIKKYGLNNHLNKINYVGKEDSYLKQLYGRTLFVLQINRTKEFENYKKYIFNLIKDIQ